MNNLVKRALSGAVFVLLVIGSILWHPYSFAVVFVALTAWALLEFYHIIELDGVYPEKTAGTVAGVSLFAGAFLYMQGWVDVNIFLWLIPLLTIILVLRLYRKDEFSFRGWAYTIAGVVYIAVPFSLLNGLVFPSHPATSYTPGILIGFFTLLWTNDTFAYLIGVWLGKHRLFERISPKKSWEGFFGGLVFTLAGSLLVARFVPLTACNFVPAYCHWLVIAAIIVIFGVFGDLFESLLKRNMHIKDSGRFLPGHGGILDRFDAVLPAAPMVYFYLEIFVR
ncbi:MAG: phosphatidate cytidylyltransferase [Bacteroidales bacterium]|nr:phosphatidate cytidylyltransferase [Bacteroidales bacterium]